MIQIDNLSFSYNKQYQLLDDFSLHVRPGRITGLLGKNGAGKTTLLRLMCGLLFPKSGTCAIDGHQSVQRDKTFLENVYIIPEEFILPQVSIEQFVKVNAPFYSRFDYNMFTNIVESFGLEKKKMLNQLSYGQRKKFIVGFGLATQAQFLFLDEPTNGLDIPSKAQFRQVVANYFNENRTIIVSTHQVRDIENLVDHITVIDNGKLLMDKSLQDISNHIAITKSPHEGDKIIYSEDIVGGKLHLTENARGTESHIDLEMLFNGIVTHPDEINQLFNS